MPTRFGIQRIANIDKNISVLSSGHDVCLGHPSTSLNLPANFIFVLLEGYSSAHVRHILSADRSNPLILIKFLVGQIQILKFSQMEPVVSGLSKRSAHVRSGVWYLMQTMLF